MVALFGFTANNLSSQLYAAVWSVAASSGVSIQEAEDVITDLQKELFKAQGIDGGWGIECLGQVGDTYQDDTDFMKLFVTAVERWLHYTPLATILHAYQCQISQGQNLLPRVL